MKKKGLLMVLIVAIGLALTMGPAYAAPPCTVHYALPVGTGGVPGTTFGFVWDISGSGRVYIYTTSDTAIANALMASTNYDLLLGLVWYGSINFYKTYHNEKYETSWEPKFMFPIPTLHISGSLDCPPNDFGFAGDVLVYNYSAVGLLDNYVPAGLIPVFPPTD